MDLLGHAQAIYNCEINGGCDENSSLLRNLCSRNRDYCQVKTYQEYLKQAYRPGYQADLNLVLEYITELFNSYR